MRRFYRSRAARLLPPPPGRAPQTQTQIQIQLLHPLRAHTLQFCQGDTMILSYSIDFVRGRPNFPRLLLNALHCRCPNCRRGRIFRGWPNRVLPRCPDFGLSYFRESGYFIGGMIITYILTAFILLAAYLLSLLFPTARAFSENSQFVFWVSFAVLLTLVLVRPAYSLWLSLDFWIDPWQPGEEK